MGVSKPVICSMFKNTPYHEKQITFLMFKSQDSIAGLECVTLLSINWIILAVRVELTGT